MDADVILFLLLVLVIFIAITVFVVLVYSGIFEFPTVRTEEPPINYSCTFAYQFLRGPYSSNDVGATFTLATSIAPKAPSIGIFYDDPQKVPENELRCAIGCLISREAVTTAMADTNDVVDAEPENVITRPFVDERELEMLKKKSFRFCQLPRVDLAVVTEFPYTTPFSIWLAPNKVYPRLSDYVSSKSLCAYPMIEYYTENRIKYMAPLSKQDDFFVPEAKKDEESEDGQSSQNDNPIDGDSSSEKKAIAEETILLQKIEAEISSPENIGQEEEINVRRRKNLPHSDRLVEETTTSAKIESEEVAKRKDSSQSSASSSFEEIGVDELK